MCRGAWQATVHGVTRVWHDLDYKSPPKWGQSANLSLSWDRWLLNWSLISAPQVKCPWQKNKKILCLVTTSIILDMVAMSMYCSDLFLWEALLTESYSCFYESMSMSMLRTCFLLTTSSPYLSIAGYSLRPIPASHYWSRTPPKKTHRLRDSQSNWLNLS